MPDFVVSKEMANANKAQYLRHLSDTARDFGFAVTHGTRWSSKSGKPVRFVEISYEED